MKLFDNISKIFRKFICCPLGYHLGYLVVLNNDPNCSSVICSCCKRAFDYESVSWKLHSTVPQNEYAVKSYYFEKTKGMVFDPFNLTKEDLEFIIMVEPSLRFYAELWRTK